MAETFTPVTITNTANGSTLATNINQNFATVSDLFEDVLSLSGISPNQMQSNLDMNSNQIINLPSPATANSPVRLQDISSGITPTPSIISGNNVYTGNNVFSGTTSLTTVNGNVTFLGNNTYEGTNTFTSATINSGTINVSSITASTGNISSLTSSNISTSGLTTTNLNTTNLTSANFISTGTSRLNNPIFTGNVPWVDARVFGILPSNPDSASSFNAAFSYFSNQLGGGYLFLPAGNYVVGSPIEISTGTNVIGQGQVVTVISATSNINPVNFGASTSNASLRDLAVIGYVSATSTQPAINIASGSVANRFIFVSGQYGSSGLSTAGTDCYAEDCYIYGYSSCLQSINGANWYNRCKFDSILGGTAAVYISSLSGGGGNVENHFSMCDLSGNYSTSLYVNDTGTPSSIVVMDGCVYSSPIVITNAEWVSVNAAEIGSTTFTVSGSSVVSVVGSFSFASTVIATSSTATKVLSGNFRIS